MSRLSLLKKMLPIRRADHGLTAENVARSALVIAIFAAPLLVLPIGQDYWEIHKALALIILTAVAWTATFIAALRRRQFNWAPDRMDWAVCGLIGAVAVSGWFSGDRYLSLVGVSGSLSETVPVLMVLSSWYFLGGLLFREPRQRSLAWVALGGSVMVAVIIQLAQLSLFSFFSFISRAQLFSLIGNSSLDPAVVAAVVGPVALWWWSRADEKWQRGLIVLATVASWLLLFFLQQALAWAVFAAGMIGLVMIEARQGKKSNTRLIGLAVLLAAAGLIVQITGLASFSRVAKPYDVRLDQATSWQIATSAWRRQPAVGTGPNTWLQAFVKDRPVSYNDGSYWNVRFIKAHSAWPQILATQGAIGLAAWLAVLLGLGWRLWVRWQRSADRWALTGLFVIAVTVVGGWFTTWSLVWLVILFASLGLARAATIGAAKSQPLTVGFTVSASLMIMALAVCLYPAGRYYASLVATHQANTAINRTAAIDPVIDRLVAAVRWDPYNLEAAELLSYAYVTAAESDLKNNDDSRVGERIRAAVATVENAANRQAKNPIAYEAVNNLLNRVAVYVSDAEVEAARVFTVLRQLEPASPVHDVGYGQTLLVARSKMLKADEVTDEDRTRATEILTAAAQAFDAAISKKADYLAARLARAQVYNINQQGAEALAQLETVVESGRNVAAYWQERGTALSLLDRNDEAVAAFEQGLELDNEDVGLYLAFSEHYQLKGDTANAKAVLERGLKAIPEQSTLTSALEEMGG